MRIERQFVAVAAAGLALALAACGGGGGAGGPLTTIAADEPSLGKADAPVVMIEYASTSCSHCAQFNNDVFHEFKAKHIDTGEVRYAMREVVTEPATFAQASFVLARCAPREKYYPIIDAVFLAQMPIFQSGDMANGLKQIALAAGMTEQQYQECVTNEANYEALEKRLQKNVREGKIEGTPTFYFNGEKYTGAPTLEAMSKAVADAKAKAK
jgi:protein-disulfide isomerase